VLGAAAGGGLPQWNCNCANCSRARREEIPALTQSSVAIGDDQGRWFLINASPDLPAQISASRPLQPDPASLRGTPIAAVLLTNADLDHTLGLVSLREGGKLNIYATRAVREAVDICPGVTAIMETFGRVTWSEPADKLTALRGADGTESSVHFRAIDLPGKAPKFAQEIGSNGRHSVAYQLVDRRTGGRLLIAPDVAGINDGLRTALSDSDAVLFDGTFWSADELGRVKDGASSADEMGHMTIKDGSLALLKSLTAARKIYIHINNTNPILAPGSPERAAVEAAGIVAGFDGMEFEL
jgi:pyrroloquinoline quinone biosynthesis protein B